MKKSVYNQDGLLKLIQTDRIQALSGFIPLPATSGSPGDIGPASIDVGIVDEAYRVQDVVLIDQRRRKTVRDILKMMGATRISLGSTMEVGVSYVVKANIDEVLLTAMQKPRRKRLQNR